MYDEAFVDRLVSVSASSYIPGSQKAPRGRRLAVGAAAACALTVGGGLGVAYGAGIVEPPWSPAPTHPAPVRPTPSPAPSTLPSTTPGGKDGTRAPSRPGATTSERGVSEGRTKPGAVDPTKKAKPTQAATPTKKPKPTKKAKPTQAATPTKKPKPTKAAGPTKAAEPTIAAEPSEADVTPGA